MSKSSHSFFFIIIIFCLLTSNQNIAQLKEIRKLQHSLKFTKDKKSLVDKYNRLAMLSQMRYRDSCQYYSSKALKIADDIDYPKGVADALNCQGVYYLSLNNYLSAKYFNDAFAIYKELRDVENQAQLLMNISVLMFIDNNKSEAKKYIYNADKKIKLAQKDSIRSLILTDILGMDPTLTNVKRNEICKIGLRIAEKYKDYPMIICSQNNIGIQLYNDGKKLEGIEMLRNSLTLAEHEGSEYVKVGAYMALGEMMFDLKKYKEGIAYYELGMKDSEKFGYTDRYLAFADRLYNFYKKKKDTQNAFKYASLLLTKQNEYAIAVKKSGYTYLSYISRENLLEKTKEKYKQEKRLALFLIIIILAMLLTGFFLWLALKNRKRFVEAQLNLHKVSLERNKELEISEKFNTMLISILAHDIREPFSNINMITQLFDKGEIESQEEINMVMSELTKITSQGISFMDGILLWIKSQKHNYNVQKEQLNAVEILNEANQFFVNNQKEKAITIHSSVEQELNFYAPRQIALFIFRNLLNNATKYSKKGSVIYLSASIEDNCTIFKIRDTGNGMCKDTLKSLFDIKAEFFHTSINGGVGVALKISHEMLNKIQGKIWAESEIGKGTTFYVAFQL
ncbi:sensor histidine kinase [Flavobacterium sp. UBA7680]|uniref:ATP-binding protein n=1 Tax=Flavobacterium sp. UBA7680 TaxID=1946559 RepID=UPI0025BB2071|nr:HAMP domain-containing sensor histidine kinase [Flavobacterium sp. UBA7680]